MMAKLLKKDPYTYHKDYTVFIEDLKQFHDSRGTPFRRIPCINGKEIDLYLLYHKVTAMGGWLKVNEEKKWDEIRELFHIPKACANASQALKQIYVRFLNIYEKMHHFGEDPDDNSDIGDKVASLISSVPCKYNYQQHEISESSRVSGGLSMDHASVSNYDKLMLSLMSGLPNEVDFAINVCTLLSNEGKFVMKVDKTPKLVDLLLAQAGIYNDNASSLRPLFDEELRVRLRINFQKFWDETVEDKEVRDLLGPINKDKEKLDPTDDDELFCLSRNLGMYDFEGQRIFQIAIILRNLSFEEENVPILATNPTFYKFLLLCSHCRWSALRQIGLDTLGNIAIELVLDPIDYLSTQLMFKTITRCISSSDKFFIIRGMEILGKLCQVEANEDAIMDNLEQRAYQDICLMLTVQDIMLIIYTLEVLYQLSELGETPATNIAKVHKTIEILVNLTTVEAQSYGPNSLIGMKVIEYVPTVTAATPASQTNSKQSSTSTPASAQKRNTTGAQGTENENEIFANNWLQAHCEADSECSVSRTDLYAEYLASYSKLAKSGILNATQFSNCLRNVFPNSSNKRVDSQGGTQMHHEGIRKRSVPLPMQQPTPPVHSWVPPRPVTPHAPTPSPPPQSPGLSQYQGHVPYPRQPSPSSALGSHVQPSASHGKKTHYSAKRKTPSSALPSTPKQTKAKTIVPYQAFPKQTFASPNTGPLKTDENCFNSPILQARLSAPLPTSVDHGLVGEPKVSMSNKSLAHVSPHLGQPKHCSNLQVLLHKPPKTPPNKIKKSRVQSPIQTTPSPPTFIPTSFPQSPQSVGLSRPDSSNLIKSLLANKVSQNIQRQQLLQQQQQFRLQNSNVKPQIHPQSPPAPGYHSNPTNFQQPSQPYHPAYSPTLTPPPQPPPSPVLHPPATVQQSINLPQTNPHPEPKIVESHPLHNDETAKDVQANEDLIGEPPVAHKNLSSKNNSSSIAPSKPVKVKPSQPTLPTTNVIVTSKTTSTTKMPKQVRVGSPRLNGSPRKVQLEVCAQVEQAKDLVDNSEFHEARIERIENHLARDEGFEDMDTSENSAKSESTEPESEASWTDRTQNESRIKSNEQLISDNSCKPSRTEASLGINCGKPSAQTQGHLRDSHLQEGPSLSVTCEGRDSLERTPIVVRQESHDDSCSSSSRSTNLDSSNHFNGSLSNPFPNATDLPQAAKRNENSVVEKGPKDSQLRNNELTTRLKEADKLDSLSLLLAEEKLVKDTPLLNGYLPKDGICSIDRELKVVINHLENGGQDILSEAHRLMEKLKNDPKSSVGILRSISKEAVSRQEFEQSTECVNTDRKNIRMGNGPISNGEQLQVKASSSSSNSGSNNNNNNILKQPLLGKLIEKCEEQTINNKNCNLSTLLSTNAETPSQQLNLTNSVSVIRGPIIVDSRQSVVKQFSDKPRNIELENRTKLTPGTIIRFIPKIESPDLPLIGQPQLAPPPLPPISPPLTPTSQIAPAFIYSKQEILAPDSNRTVSIASTSQGIKRSMTFDETFRTETIKKVHLEDGSGIVGEPQPVIPPVQPKLEYMCEWQQCKRTFTTPKAVFTHACRVHVPFNSDGICLWESCDNMKRQRWSLITHLQDLHCAEQILRLQALRRQQLAMTGTTSISAPTPPPPHPGYAQNAAWQAIKRHATMVSGSQTMDEKEGPVTKSIRLSAALVLRNIAKYSPLGKSLIRRYESHLASIAISNVEASRTISQCLWELQQTESACHPRRRAVL